jgi:hypothetical protein
MYRVYVIQLKWRALEIDTNRRRSPTGLPYVYVGSSWHPPEVRLAHHRLGGMGASSKVRNFALGLRPDLYEQVPALPDEWRARQTEAAWADELASVGFTTRSDGVLRRPKGALRPMTEIHPNVEDHFDQVVFAMCARRGSSDRHELAHELLLLHAPDASWERVGRFAHVDAEAVATRLEWLDSRGFLETAASCGAQSTP